MDGAGPFRRFWNITLPMISPVLSFNVLLGTIHSFQALLGDRMPGWQGWGSAVARAAALASRVCPAPRRGA